MSVERFAELCRAGSSRERAECAEAIAGALATGRLDAADRTLAERLIGLLDDDPAPTVRWGLARGACAGPHAPAWLVSGLCRGPAAVAAHVAEHAPELIRTDWGDLVGRDDAGIRRALASRRQIDPAQAIALVETGDAELACLLLSNDGAQLDHAGLAAIYRRFHDDTAVCEALSSRADLPGAIRHALTEGVAARLSSCDLVQNVLGNAIGGRIVAEALEGAAADIAGRAAPAELPAFVDHLEGVDRLTPALILRAACEGHAGFVVGALADLSGQGEASIGRALASGRLTPIRRVLARAGLHVALAPFFRETTALWAAIRADAIDAGGASVPRLVMERLGARVARSGDADGPGDLVRYLTRLAGEGEREARRDRALAA